MNQAVNHHLFLLCSHHLIRLLNLVDSLFQSPLVSQHGSRLGSLRVNLLVNRQASQVLSLLARRHNHPVVRRLCLPGSQPLNLHLPLLDNPHHYPLHCPVLSPLRILVPNLLLSQPSSLLVNRLRHLLQIPLHSHPLCQQVSPLRSLLSQLHNHQLLRAQHHLLNQRFIHLASQQYSHQCSQVPSLLVSHQRSPVANRPQHQLEHLALAQAINLQRNHLQGLVANLQFVPLLSHQLCQQVNPRLIQAPNLRRCQLLNHPHHLHRSLPAYQAHNRLHGQPVNQQISPQIIQQVSRPLFRHQDRPSNLLHNQRTVQADNQQ